MRYSLLNLMICANYSFPILFLITLIFGPPDCMCSPVDTDLRIHLTL